MLIKEPAALETNPILLFIGNGKKSKEITKGIYEIAHFGSSDFLSNYTTHDYGVCDNYEQILEYYPEIIESQDKFVITITAIVKSEQPEEGGWRWHKWGDYIGTQNPQHEYLYDEENIEKIYVFHIYKKKSGETNEN